jgi:hypothetical protein
MVEGGADHAVQHRVADELEALVVRGAEAPVRQRGAEQVGIAEGVSEPRAKRVIHSCRVTSKQTR